MMLRDRNLASPWMTKRMSHEHLPNQPYHAHVYFDGDSRDVAEALNAALRTRMKSGNLPGLLFVGSLKEGKAGPHPKPQFEVHFMANTVAAIREAIVASGLTALVHPLTDDDLADHTRLADWIGEPLALDLTTLDPPGHNKGVARFGTSDF
ncbi:DOPA 4,5-dioxygenase family protein [Luteibacter sp. NPDC031894]|uniref:DOPA 4,5-dioxygenase family protein n=1 Tax=Luteibacter sp. NPDC031894 TaxID=3390572 RepID=UPI003D03D4A3